VFDYLPLGALVANSVLVVHGGLGKVSPPSPTRAIMPVTCGTNTEQRTAHYKSAQNACAQTSSASPLNLSRAVWPRQFGLASGAELLCTRKQQTAKRGFSILRWTRQRGQTWVSAQGDFSLDDIRNVERPLENPGVRTGPIMHAQLPSERCAVRPMLPLFF
jgi:hypothetical protein